MSGEINNRAGSAYEGRYFKYDDEGRRYVDFLTDETPLRSVEGNLELPPEDEGIYREFRHREIERLLSEIHEIIDHEQMA